MMDVSQDAARRYSSGRVVAAADAEKAAAHTIMVNSARSRLSLLKSAATAGSVTTHYTFGKTLGAQPTRFRTTKAGLP